MGELTNLTKREEEILDLIKGHPASMSDISKKLNKNYKIVHESCSNLHKKEAVDLTPQGRKVIVSGKVQENNLILSILKEIKKRGKVTPEEFDNLIYGRINLKNLNDSLCNKSAIGYYLRKISGFLEESISLTEKGNKVLRKVKK